MNTVQQFQIGADLHTHTVASTHGYSTVNEMAAAARETGVKLANGELWDEAAALFEGGAL